MTTRTRLALLWHMHQPMYVAPETGEAILPWVRLHATHAYRDMGRVLERFPGVRATVNFVPSLVEQLERAGEGTLRERFLEATRARPEAMSPEQRRFVLRHFFMVERERVLRASPRYAELLARRGVDDDAVDPARFEAQDVRDVQVLFNLAWMGFSARTEEPEIARLVAKDRGYTEGDKQAVLDVQQRLLRGVLPMWRRLAERGQVELSTTPYFHPILPLVCDTDSARRAMPGATLPPRFQRPEDAREQVRRALEKHAAVFGRRPAGMWPAEGSVSPEAAEVLAEEGVRWVATDEGILARSHPAPASRAHLYQAHGVRAGGAELAIAFRDRALSDRIGFSYASMPAAAAVGDFLERVRRAGAEARAAGIAEPLVAVVLDGENAWEHYEGHGAPFLEELHAALASTPDVVTVTMSEALAGPRRLIERLHSGSWIESNFRIWIGHEEDNLGWALLGQVRALHEAHERRGDVPHDRLEAARRLLLAAEGSDWFWWYGDDFETANAAEFDQLFRDHLIHACRLLGEAVPPALHVPVSRRARKEGHVGTGTGDARPRGALLGCAGRAPAFAHWVNAGTLRPVTGHGSMYRGAGRLERVEYGVDGTHLRLRLVGVGTAPGGAVEVATEGGAAVVLAVGCEVVDPGEGWARAAGQAVEAGVPLARLAPADAARVALRVTWRHPSDGAEQLPEQGFVVVETGPGPAESWLV
jgi:alpha-amylase/alpha-mannosidase (GH57 family)